MKPQMLESGSEPIFAFWITGHVDCSAGRSFSVSFNGESYETSLGPIQTDKPGSSRNPSGLLSEEIRAAWLCQWRTITAAV